MSSALSRGNHGDHHGDHQGSSGNDPLLALAKALAGRIRRLNQSIRRRFFKRSMMRWTAPTPRQGKQEQSCNCTWCAFLTGSSRAILWYRRRTTLC